MGWIVAKHRKADESHKCTPPSWWYPDYAFSRREDVLKGSLWRCEGFGCKEVWVCTRSGDYVTGLRRPKWKRV